MTIVSTTGRPRKVTCARRLFPARSVCRAGAWVVALLLLLVFGARPTLASAALLMEEPFGDFGAFNPTGHAAVYLNHVCADTPTRLRMCEPGEKGVVISRYHKINGMDWLAVPLVPYLYAVEQVADIPKEAAPDQVEALRAAYWREHLQTLAPAKEDGLPPGGEWIQLVGSSFDRKIHGFEMETTREQDERFIAIFNDRKNVGRFNLFFHNCADFSRVVMNSYFPGAIRRNYIADLGLMTPKQAAKSLMKYGRKHPELHMDTFVIEQIPGTLPRSHRVDGVNESLVKSKKYMVPLVVLTPHIAGAAVIGYLTEGRLHLPKDARVFQISADMPEEPVEAAKPADETPLTVPVMAPQPAAPGEMPVQRVVPASGV